MDKLENFCYFSKAHLAILCIRGWAALPAVGKPSPLFPAWCGSGESRGGAPAWFSLGRSEHLARFGRKGNSQHRHNLGWAPGMCRRQEDENGEKFPA